MTDQQDITPEQQAAIEKAQRQEQRLLEGFQLELGRLSGQSVVDRANFKAQQEEWKEREQEYLKVIEQLSSEVETLRKAAGQEVITEPPAEPGDEPVDISKVGKARKRT